MGRDGVEQEDAESRTSTSTATFLPFTPTPCGAVPRSPAVVFNMYDLDNNGMVSRKDFLAIAEPMIVRRRLMEGGGGGGAGGGGAGAGDVVAMSAVDRRRVGALFPEGLKPLVEGMADFSFLAVRRVRLEGGREPLERVRPSTPTPPPSSLHVPRAATVRLRLGRTAQLLGLEGLR